MNALCIAAAAVFMFFPVSSSHAGDKTEERCEALLDSQNNFVEISGLRVLSGSEPLIVSTPGNQRVVSLRCFRSSAIPVPSDARVLDAGWSLNLVAVDSAGVRKIVVLEISNGQYRARVLDGTLTNDEEAELRESLNAMQTARQSE